MESSEATKGTKDLKNAEGEQEREKGDGEGPLAEGDEEEEEGEEGEEEKKKRELAFVAGKAKQAVKAKDFDTLKEHLNEHNPAWLNHKDEHGRALMHHIALLPENDATPKNEETRIRLAELVLGRVVTDDDNSLLPNIYLGKDNTNKTPSEIANGLGFVNLTALLWEVENFQKRPIKESDTKGTKGTGCAWVEVRLPEKFRNSTQSILGKNYVLHFIENAKLHVEKTVGAITRPSNPIASKNDARDARSTRDTGKDLFHLNTSFWTELVSTSTAQGIQTLFKLKGRYEPETIHVRVRTYDIDQVDRKKVFVTLVFDDNMEGPAGDMRDMDGLTRQRKEEWDTACETLDAQEKPAVVPTTIYHFFLALWGAKPFQSNGLPALQQSIAMSTLDRSSMPSEAHKEKTLKRLLLPLYRPEIVEDDELGTVGILFYGPPGTGKTKTADELKLCGFQALYTGATSGLSDSFVGGTSRNVRTIFELSREYPLRRVPCYVFVDEVDSLAMSRAKADAHFKDAQGALLTAFDKNYPNVSVIGATNYIDGIDHAMKRRLEPHLYFGRPDRTRRWQIFKERSVKLRLLTVEDVEALESTIPGGQPNGPTNSKSFRDEFCDLTVNFTPYDIEKNVIREAKRDVSCDSSACLGTTRESIICAAREVHGKLKPEGLSVEDDSGVQYPPNHMGLVNLFMNSERSQGAMIADLSHPSPHIICPAARDRAVSFPLLLPHSTASLASCLERSLGVTGVYLVNRSVLTNADVDAAEAMKTKISDARHAAMFSQVLLVVDLDSLAQVFTRQETSFSENWGRNDGTTKGRTKNTDTGEQREKIGSQKTQESVSEGTSHANSVNQTGSSGLSQSVREVAEAQGLPLFFAALEIVEQRPLNLMVLYKVKEKHLLQNVFKKLSIENPWKAYRWHPAKEAGVITNDGTELQLNQRHLDWLDINENLNGKIDPNKKTNTCFARCGQFFEAQDGHGKSDLYVDFGIVTSGPNSNITVGLVNAATDRWAFSVTVSQSGSGIKVFVEGKEHNTSALPSNRKWCNGDSIGIFLRRSDATLHLFHTTAGSWPEYMASLRQASCSSQPQGRTTTEVLMKLPQTRYVFGGKIDSSFGDARIISQRRFFPDIDSYMHKKSCLVSASGIESPELFRGMCGDLRNLAVVSKCLTKGLVNDDVLKKLHAGIRQHSAAGPEVVEEAFLAASNIAYGQSALSESAIEDMWQIVSSGFGVNTSDRTAGLGCSILANLSMHQQHRGHIDDQTLERLTAATAAAAGLGTVQKVAAGYEHALALKIDGTLWSWGRNVHGKTGQGTTTGSTLTPTQVGTDTDWHQVAAEDGNFTLAVKTDGTLWSWGLNLYYRTGQGTDFGYIHTPTQVGSDTDWIEVRAGQGWGCARKTDGTIWSWGNNADARTGQGTESECTQTPTQIGTDTDWAFIGPTFNVGTAIKTNGTLWVWGRDAGGAGLGTNVATTPTQKGTDTDWSASAQGNAVGFAVKTNGTLWAWGRETLMGINSSSGNLSSGQTQVGSDTDWNKIACASSSWTLAIKDNGTLWSWGQNHSYQTGLGTDSGVTLVPTQVGTSNGWQRAAPGNSIGFGVQYNKTPWSWGKNDNFRTAQGTDVGFTQTPAQIAPF